MKRMPYRDMDNSISSNSMPAENMDYVRVVFISANVQALLDEPGRISDWATAVGKEVSEQKPVFAAIHLQGVKGKGRNTADNVDQLIRDLDGQPGFESFQNSRQFHDLDNLGLSSIYYSKNEVKAALYDNQKREYWSAEGHRNEPPNSSFVRNERLSQGYISGASSGDPSSAYMMTRWLLFEKPFNFINLALSPDISPLDGCQKWPSESSLERKRQLNTLISGLQSQNLWDDDATFIAGNFNCSINKEKFLKDQAHTNHAAPSNGLDGTGKLSKFDASDVSGRKIFNISANKFDMVDLHDWIFNTCNGQLIKKYDQELNEFKGVLIEPSIYFLPTYPYGYDRKTETNYFLRTDCPGWKNRILTNQKAWQMMHHDSFSSSGLYYGLVGAGLNIGDYKPVSLITTICLKENKHK